jgi:hypothetical protein
LNGPLTSAKILAAMPSAIDDLLSRPIPEKLWHYTSIEGFEGIVTSKTVFATDLRFLNDREEFVHTRAVAKKIVDGTPEFDASGFRNRYYVDKAVSIAFDTGPLTNLEVFVASFSAAEDQLGQWRGYSHGSSGVSLAFDLKSFRPPVHGGSLVTFAPCVYDSVKKEELMLEAIRHFKDEALGYREKAFHEACELNPENSTLDKEKVVTEFLAANPMRRGSDQFLLDAIIKTRVDCLQIAALLKNAAFEEENEWRLVLPVLLDHSTTLKNPPKFRVGKTTLIPYIAHPFPTAAALPIVDVILGPGSDENSIFAAQRFLKSHGIDLTPRLSKVPYRAS